MIKSITSTSNPLVKKVVQLTEKAKFRKEYGLFVVEGIREITMALKGGFEIRTLLYNPDIIGFDKIMRMGDFEVKNLEIIEINDVVYDKIAYREGTEGVIGLFSSKETDIKTVSLASKNPLILVAEAPEKPGNIGALLRTADAAGVDLFIIANPNTDLYNPNIIRASLGSVFTTKVVASITDDVIAWLRKNNIEIYCALLSNKSVPYFETDFKGPCAIVLGTESEGLSEEWVKNADKNIIIPMHGTVDSMNVSVSGAILVFEALRQRSQNF